MQHLADWYFALIFFVTLLGFLVAAILCCVNKTDTFASRLLAGFLVCICILLLNNELMATQFFLNFPHFWRVAVFFSFCFQALGYLYVRTVLQQSFGFKKWDFLFFLPAFVYTLTWIPFYSLSASEKLPIIEKIISNNALIAKEPEALLPPGVGTLARAIYGMILVCLQFALIFQWKRKLKLSPSNYDQNLATYNWLFYFTSMGALLYSVAFILISFQLTTYVSIWHTVIAAITCTILFIVIYLLRKPNILYGMTGWFYQAQPSPPIDNQESSKIVKPLLTMDAPRNSLSLEQGVVYKLQLEHHFTVNHPYLKGGYSMSDLSSELGIPAHQLSAFINQEYGKNFNELINNFRVDYLINLVRDSKEYQNYTLEALGKLAGFKSRAAFYAAVKKKSNLTPATLFSSK